MKALHRTLEGIQGQKTQENPTSVSPISLDIFGSIQMRKEQIAKQNNRNFDELKTAEIERLTVKCFSIEVINKQTKIVAEKNLSLDDFNIFKELGHGSFGVVLIVSKKRSPHSFYALKCIRKDHVLQHNDIENAMFERDVCKLGFKNTYIIKMFATFQNEVSIYIFVIYAFG